MNDNAALLVRGMNNASSRYDVVCVMGFFYLRTELVHWIQLLYLTEVAGFHQN
jgi:hypothetical protein